MNAEREESVIYSGHPSWRSMLDFHLGGLALAAAGGAIARLATKNWGLAIAVFAGLLALSLLVGSVRRVSTHYTVTDRRLHIRRGILSRTEQHTTIDRVQNVETHQSLLGADPADRHGRLRHRRDRRLPVRLRRRRDAEAGRRGR